MQRPREPHTTHRHGDLFRAAPPCLPASPPPPTIKHHLLAQAQKDNSNGQEATAGATLFRRLPRSIIHQVLAPTMCLCFHNPAHNTRGPLRRLPAHIHPNNRLLQSCNFRQSDRLRQGHTRTQLWRNNNKGKLSSSTNEKVGRRDNLATMAARDSQTPSGRG